MDDNEIDESLEKQIQFLKRTIPPDDIYLFAQQNLLAAFFFLRKWSDWVDLGEEMKKDPLLERLVLTISRIGMMQDLNEKIGDIHDDEIGLTG